MTYHELETGWLSLRYWLRRCVLPSAIVLAGLILLLPFLFEIQQYRDQLALLFGFVMVYFVLFRAGHIFMMRSMHMDLKKTYGDKYQARLSALPADLSRSNIGFTLARIKRDLIHDDKGPKKT